MPLFLDTRGLKRVAVAICDRCKKKVPWVDLRPDGDNPGLMVCSAECSDEYDPYKYAARQPEDISLPYVRPEEPLS